MAASVITKKTRTITPGGRSTCFRARFAGATASRGTSSANSTPHTIAIAAGTAKAARQPMSLTRKPVRSAAKAMPRLPASPFTPMVKPGFVAPCTIIGIPTGW